jgi:hypothetical protein
MIAEEIAVVGIPPHTEEWHLARLGKITASRSYCLMVNGKGPHGLGDGAVTYAKEVVAGMMGIAPEKFSTADMEEGNLREPESIDVYENETFNLTTPAGFILIPGTIIGATPDALVNHNGQLQAKNPRPKAHMELLLSRSVPRPYWHQCQHELMVTGREWCDFISYCPSFPDQKKLVVVRIERDDRYINDDFMPRIASFLEYVNGLKKDLGIE